MTHPGLEILIHSENELRALGAVLASGSTPGMLIFLQGELGVGKTTLVRGFLQALGHAGAVKSPTYTIVEPYQVAGYDIFHFDLYRLHTPTALEEIGIRDYITATAICLIEWPECGAGQLPIADLVCQMEFHAVGRKVLIKALTPKGQALLAAVSAAWGRQH